VCLDAQQPALLRCSLQLMRNLTINDSVQGRISAVLLRAPAAIKRASDD
jgi:hypothetical protein